MVLLWLLRRRWGSVEGRETLQTLGRILIASAVMSLAIWGVISLGQRAELAPFLILLIGGAVGLPVYIVAGLVLRIRTLYRLPAMLLGR